MASSSTLSRCKLKRARTVDFLGLKNVEGCNTQLTEGVEPSAGGPPAPIATIAERADPQLQLRYHARMIAGVLPIS